jgi:hypothetical protein
VRVLIDSQELGYLPRDVAQLLAPEIDAGLQITATVADIEEGAVPTVSVTLAAADAAAT